MVLNEIKTKWQERVSGSGREKEIREQKPNVIQTNESKQKKNIIIMWINNENTHSDIYHFDGYLRSVVLNMFIFVYFQK